MADDIVFDQDTQPKPDTQQEQESTGDRPVFRGPGDIAAAWLEEASDGTYYLSVQIDLPFLGKENIPLFPTEAKDMEKLFQKAGTVASDK
jgi:uncharacterized protein (DUF736 family)